MIDSISASTPERARTLKTSKSDDARLKDACGDFEALFFHKMLQAMRRATMEGGLIKKSNAENIFTDMLDQEYSKLISSKSERGMADIMYEQMKKHLEANFSAETEEGLVSLRAGMDSSAMHSELFVDKLTKV